MPPWVLEGMKPPDVAGRIGEIEASYREHGVAVMPGLLVGDPDFERYLADLRFLYSRIFAWHGQAVGPADDLGDIVARLKELAPLDGRIVADIGTQPNKMVSANRVKFADHVTRMLYAAFGGDGAILATPHAGDTLHHFMPGEEFHRYNLPIHQDYQYLMQSPRQATLCIGMSRPYDDVGGLEYWPGSHKLGVLPSDRNENNSFRVVDGDRLMRAFSCESYFWDVGDVALFDSLLCHRSIPNTSVDRGRVVQLFRFSDLRHPDAEKYGWRSTIYQRRGASFEVEHRDLYT